jgi:hypothetical protein
MTADFPAGAIHNGRVLLARISEHISAGSPMPFGDWNEFNECWLYLELYAMRANDCLEAASRMENALERALDFIEVQKAAIHDLNSEAGDETYQDDATAVYEQGKIEEALSAWRAT